MATNVGFNHKSKYDVPSSMLTVQNEPPPSDVIAMRLPVSTTTTRATKKRAKGGGAWKPPSTVMAGLMTTLTLLWFFGLHFSPDSFYMFERVHLRPSATEPNLTVHLNFAGFFIVLSVLLGALALHPNMPLCGMLNPCCKMIPLFIFPGIAAYMIFEGISVIWYIVVLFEQKGDRDQEFMEYRKQEEEYQNRVGGPFPKKPPVSMYTEFCYVMFRLFLDMLCCLALAFLLLYFAIKSLGQPPPTMPDASFGCNSYFMPMPSAMFSQDPSTSTLVVSQAGAQQAPVYNKPGTVYVPMQRTPLMPNLPPTRTTKPQAADEPKTKQQQDVERQQQDASGRQQRRSGRCGEDSGRQPVTLTTQMVEVTKAKTAAELAKSSGRSSETNTKEGPTADSFMAYDDDEEKKKKKKF